MYPAGEPSTSPRFPSDLWGNHPCGNFLMISMRKFGWNEGEFSMWISLPHFPVESLGMFPRGNFPCVSPRNVKMEYNDIGRVPVMWKYPSDDLMSFLGELKCLQVRGNFPLIQTLIWKFPLDFRVDSRFTYNPNIRVDSLHQQPPSPGIPCRILEISLAGK